MKQKIYKIRVSREVDIEVLVKDTNGNRAIETAREFVKEMYKESRITSANLLGIVDDPKIVISKNFKENKNGK